MQTKEQAWADLRKGRNLSALAEEIDVSRAAVSAWKYVPAERIIAVSIALGVPAQRLRPDLYPQPDPWSGI